MSGNALNRNHIRSAPANGRLFFCISSLSLSRSMSHCSFIHSFSFICLFAWFCWCFGCCCYYCCTIRASREKKRNPKAKFGSEWKWMLTFSMIVFIMICNRQKGRAIPHNICRCPCLVWVSLHWQWMFNFMKKLVFVHSSALIHSFRKSNNIFQSAQQKNKQWKTIETKIKWQSELLKSCRWCKALGWQSLKSSNWKIKSY